MSQKQDKEIINVENIINYWVLTSDNDYKTMENLFKSKDYNWCLFLGHLVIEKLLKALFVKVNQNIPPPIHDLKRLSDLSKLKLTDEQINFFNTVSTFNINIRYDNYKLAFYKKCTKEYATQWYKNIKEYRIWIKDLLIK